MDFT
ncbi:hypothetical protein D046_1173A, partial [Vibrio parahaemolyticus V-223/04]|jgi:hypothetical protein